MEKHNFWKINRIYLIANALLILVLLFLGSIYDISREFVFYEVSFALLLTLVVLAVCFFRYQREKEEARYLAEIERQEREKWEKLRENQDFFALWTHQIKTPIAALNLLLQDPETDGALCRQELFKIENYVDMALNYLRFENMSGDLVLERCPLEPMVKKLVKKYATIFIHKHLSVELEGLEGSILTDEKWFSFALEQVLSNALKYTSEGGVRIYTERTDKEICLVVSDTGIGIRPEDLPRIFERGFTGYNGRVDQKASGLGLYLCKGICRKLGCRVEACSDGKKGTDIRMHIPAEQHTYLTKL
ncbi:MAG: sensor histidine kinase [Lachnospiraceae bacterium]|nr:sensor histidine kinase [Lachnospiraceae bacterium]